MAGAPKSSRSTPRKEASEGSRNKPTFKNLLKNNIKIYNTPENSNRPDYVKKLSSDLLQNFSGIVPITRARTFRNELGNLYVPDGAIEVSYQRTEIQQTKEDRFDSGLAIRKECEYLIQTDTPAEFPWNGVWSGIFKRHLDTVRVDHRQTMESHFVLLQVSDTLFSETNEIYDVKECQLTLPKPDTTLVFTTICKAAGKEKSCFSRKILDDLLEINLLSSPFQSKHQVCFPWGIYEGKRPELEKYRLEPECQAANAAVKCIKMLERLRGVPGSSEVPKVKAEDLLPIPCITCIGPKWKLWICYRSNDSGSKPAYKLDKIFEGDMENLWSCLQLVYIVERLKEWALDQFKPWIHRRLKPWIKFSQEPDGINLREQNKAKAKSKLSRSNIDKGDFGYSHPYLYILMFLLLFLG